MTTMTKLFGGQMMSPVPDPYPVYKRLRDEQPVILMDSLLGEIYMVTRYEDVLAILKDNALYSSRANARGIGMVMGRTILEMDGKEHIRHRNVVSPAFLPRALSGIQSVVESIAHELIDQFVDRGRADLVPQFTFTFPMRVITHIIGIPVEDYEAFHQWALDLVSVGDDPPRGFAAAQRIVEYLTPVLQERKKNPRDDLLSTLVHAEVDGNRLTDEEVLGFMRLLLPAGAETTYRLLGSTLFALLTHRDQFEEVLTDRSKMDLAIDETLRWESPVQFVSREATRTVTLSGFEIPAGASMSVVLGSANRDERHYDNPNRFDMYRRATDHVAFGFGQHFCAGSHLARLESRAALTALFDRLPNLRLDPAETSPQVVGLAFRSPDRLPVLFG